MRLSIPADITIHPSAWMWVKQPDYIANISQHKYQGDMCLWLEHLRYHRQHRYPQRSHGYAPTQATTITTVTYKSLHVFAAACEHIPLKCDWWNSNENPYPNVHSVSKLMRLFSLHIIFDKQIHFAQQYNIRCKRKYFRNQFIFNEIGFSPLSLMRWNPVEKKHCWNHFKCINFAEFPLHLIQSPLYANQSNIID